MTKDVGLLINSSRGILYAANDSNFATAAAKQATILQQQMEAILDAR
jgi:orotidine-5'-phosphate decarboxylase